MNFFLRKSLLPAAGVVAVALLIAVASPRAVHAVAAALVQIVNTPATAVPILHAPAASQLYNHSCVVSFSGNSSSYCHLPTVPTGQTLFVETVSFWGHIGVGTGVYEAYLGNGTADGLLYVPVSQQYPGFVEGTLSAKAFYGAGSTPMCSMSLDQTTGNNFRCYVFGYLAPAQ
jgi:hypothetical protein